MNKNLSIGQYIAQEPVKKAMSDVLGDRTPQFITSVVSLVNTNAKLQDCDKQSLFNACLTAAALDLPINQNLGFAYVIPYNDRKLGMVAQFQMGYKGFIQLAQRSGQVQTINSTDVREGEIKNHDLLTGEIEFEWVTENRESKPIIGFVAYFKLLSGFEKSLYMSVIDIKKHGIKYSQTAKKGYGLWVDDFNAMAKKTVTKLLLAKYAPLNASLIQAVSYDQAVIKDDLTYVDNIQEDPQFIAAKKDEDRLVNAIMEAKTLKELKACEIAVNGQDNPDVFDIYKQREEQLCKK